MFSAFDKDGSGLIDFDEFLIALRVSLLTLKCLLMCRIIIQNRYDPDTELDDLTIVCNCPV